MQILLNSAHFNSQEYAKRKHSKKLQQTQHIVGASFDCECGETSHKLYIGSQSGNRQAAGQYLILIAEVFYYISHVM